MYEFLFTNALGETIYFSNLAPFLLESISGISSVQSDVQSEKAPYQDGSTYIDTLLNARSLDFTCQIRPYTEENRRKAIRVLNSKLGVGTLRFTKNGVWRELKCVVEDNPNMLDGHQHRRPGMQRFTFSLMAHNPYWTDAEQSFTLAGFIGGFEFPFSFPFSLGEIGSTLTVTNDGDTVAPLFIELTGPLTNPTLTNQTTGEFITLAQDLPSGYTLEINTAMGEKSVVIVSDLGVRSNGFHYIDPSSTLFGLSVGNNTLSYTATVQPSAIAVTIFFKNRYIGV